MCDQVGTYIINLRSACTLVLLSRVVRISIYSSFTHIPGVLAFFDSFVQVDALVASRGGWCHWVVERLRLERHLKLLLIGRINGCFVYFLLFDCVSCLFLRVQVFHYVLVA